MTNVVGQRIEPTAEAASSLIDCGAAKATAPASALRRCRAGHVDVLLDGEPDAEQGRQAAAAGYGFTGVSRSRQRRLAEVDGDSVD